MAYRTCSSKKVMFLPISNMGIEQSLQEGGSGGQWTGIISARGAAAELSDVVSRGGQQPCRQSILVHTVLERTRHLRLLDELVHI